MSCSLPQPRLTSGRDCSTSYVQITRHFTACMQRASRRKHFLRRPGLLPTPEKETPVFCSTSDDCLHRVDSTVGEPPIGESVGGERPEHLDEQPTVRSPNGLPAVPWGLDKVVQVMVLWLLAFIVLGQVLMPLVFNSLGIDRLELTVRSHAVVYLCLDLAQLGVTLGILWSCLRQYRPRQLGLFPVRLRGAWLAVVAVSCGIFPAVDWLAHQCMSWFPSELDSLWAMYMEQSLLTGDWITNMAFFCVVSLCAPIWEEAMFRGFLLPSLAQVMPTPAAVLLSSTLFAMCHMRLQNFLPLLVLGIVFSLIYIRSNNLAPPILLHSAWNLYVLVSIVLRPW